MPRAKRKPSYKVTKESTGKTLVRCETCKVTLAWTADPAEIVPAIDAHHAELHPEWTP